ncbi:MAG TPA: ATP-binding protein [Vicinamibacterales bacterium]|nr:ATP-binding protein [Vicinamibacterales bacterium]
MITFAPAHETTIVPFPRAPRTMAEAGLPFDLVLPLILKTLHFSGEQSGGGLAARLGVQYSVIEPVLQHLKTGYLVEMTGGGLTGGPAFVYRLTEGGRTRALSCLEQNQYVGVAPVPLAAYDAYMRAFAAAAPKTATRERVKHAFRKLVLSQRVLDQLGPAINGGHSIFVYGPPGNGKTVISQAIQELLDSEIAIPHAIVADGHIIRVFDAAAHEPLPIPEAADAIDSGGELRDERWVRCRRPSVMVGGELELHEFDLTYRESTKVYQSPLQLTANGGVLIIDDFGRQKCSPVAMLNRWITPLESRIDFLTLKTGQKVVIPFALLVVFATNIKPSELLDEAFLRRIRYKVFAESPTLSDFKLIFERCCRDRNLDYDEAIVDSLVREFYTPRGIPLRGTHPRDLIDHTLSLAEYFGRPPKLSLELLVLACLSYFVDDRDSKPSGD